MTEEVKDQAKLKTRQPSLEYRQRALETHLAWAQSFRKEVVETRDRALAEVDEKIQSLTKEINELSEIADLPAERQTTAIDYQS